MTRVVVLCWLYRLLACGLVAAPVAGLVGEQVATVGTDAVLWEPGGLWLTEVGRWLEPTWRPPARRSGMVAVAVAAGWLLVLAGLVAEATGSRRPWRDGVSRGGSMLLFAGLGLLLQAVVLVGGALATLHAATGRLAAVALVGTWWVAVSAFVDVARVARFSTEDAWAALDHAARVLARSPRLWWAGAWRWGLAMACLAAGLAGAQSVAASGGAVWGGAAMPALGLLGWTVLRASWLRAIGGALKLAFPLRTPASMH